MEWLPTEAGLYAHLDWATSLCTTIRPQPAIGVPSSRKVTLPVGAGLPVKRPGAWSTAPRATVVALAITEGVVDAVPATTTVAATELKAKLSLPGSWSPSSPASAPGPWA